MNMFIGNLSYEVNEGDLMKAFESFGHVETVDLVLIIIPADQKDLVS